MALDHDVEELKRKKICCKCVDDDFLKQDIIKQGKKRKCSYCRRIAKCVSVEDLADRVEKAFEQHYHRTSNEPTSYQYAMLKDKEFNYVWEREGDNVVDAIAYAVGLPDDLAASDIQTILSERHLDFDNAAMGIEEEFDSESCYERNEPNAGQWHGEWYYFQDSLKTQTRFFSQSASALLKSIFNGVDEIETDNNCSLIVDAGPNTKLEEVFRARGFQSDKVLGNALMQPDKELGPPPANLARAGRMNAQGISVFYGANTPETALSEIRPPVGSKVVIARFEITRKLRLLDLTALDSVASQGSIFDPTFIDRIQKALFLRTLGNLMTIPVMPDNETLDYLPTQAVADFLSSENIPKLDGIIFPSAQTAGNALNVVLFHKASIVEKIETFGGTDLDVHLGYGDSDGWTIDYTVYEKDPPKAKQTKRKSLLPTGFYSLVDTIDNFNKPQVPSLKIDIESIRVHHVSSVKFTTQDYPVTRVKLEKREPGF
ncbi:MAG: hypothetical protein A2277_08200 [Desulfobacterales bacterium RIFOXYA12_FULL_46_15]|nr:MAG: hypothetical protein A2277_08200 [Desulfobacterales bacterium RIFOXYA12_FULL_46_15]